MGAILAGDYSGQTGYISRIVADRQSLSRREMEDYLRTVTTEEHLDRPIHRLVDYSSLECYTRSLATLRTLWADCLGIFDLPEPTKDADFTLLWETEFAEAYLLTLPINHALCARAILAVPRDRRGALPLVIAQHGIGSSPERVFGLDDDSGVYHAYGTRLVEAGYVVLAPHHITEAAPRARLQRMCLLMGKTLWGLEIAKLKVLLDYVSKPRLTLGGAPLAIDLDAIGMWGISLGGAYTLFTMPLEPRIRAGVCTAWFNDRLHKMIYDDPRYSCFLSTTEEHIFVPGWLESFADSDLAALTCPRPLLVQTGKADGIAWWPQVVDEVKEARQHYAQLGLAERIVFDLHEGGHEIRLTSGLDFLEKWLTIQASIKE